MTASTEARDQPASPGMHPRSPKSPRAQPPAPAGCGGFASLPSELVDLVLLFVGDSPAQRLVCRRFAAQLRWMCEMSHRDDPSRFARALMERMRSAALRLGALRHAMRERDFIFGTSVLTTGAYAFVYGRIYLLCTTSEHHRPKGFFARGPELSSRGNRLMRFHNRLHFEFSRRLLPVLDDQLVRLKVVSTLRRLCNYLSNGFCWSKHLPDIGTSLSDLCASHAAGNADRYLLRLDRFGRANGTLDHWRACVDAQAERHTDPERLGCHWPYPRLVPCLDDAACRAFALLEQDTSRVKTDAEMDLIRALLVDTPAEPDGEAQNA